MSRQQKIDQILAYSDPLAYMQKLMADRALAEAVLSMEKIQGPSGRTPVKGVDYFTEEDIKNLIALIRSQVRNGSDGKPGRSIIGPRGLQGIPGETPVRGVHYWTKDDIDAIVSTILEEISKKQKEVAAEKAPISYKDIMDAPDLTDLPKLIQFLKMGGFRGGGGSSTSTSGLTVITVSGTIDDSNMSFTAASQPTLLCINGASYQQTGGAITWTYVAGAITLSSPVGTGGSIYGVV